MNFLEKELEDWFFEHPEAFIRDVQWTHRQLVLPSGIADVVGVDKQGIVHLVELKAVSLSSKDICQVLRYKADIKTGCRFCAVKAYLVGPGDVSDQLLHEANAANVELVNVKPAFKLNGPWSFNEKTTAERRESLLKNESLEVFRTAWSDHRAVLREQWDAEEAEDRQAFYEEVVADWEAANG